MLTTRGASLDHRADHFEEVGGIGAPGVFGVKLHVVRELAGAFDRIDGHLQDLALLLGQRLAVAVVAEFAGDMNVGGADAGVNARPLTLGQGLAACLDIGGHGAGERADGRSLNFAADALDRLEIFRRRVGIPGLDDVHVQQRQLPGDDDLVAASEARSGGLFAVAQSRVEDCYFFRHGLSTDCSTVGQAYGYSQTTGRFWRIQSSTQGW